MTRKKVLQALEKTMQGKLQSIVGDLLTSQMQLKQLLPSQLSERVSMLGMGGYTSQTDLVDTLMHWYDTLLPKQKAKLWTLIVDFLMLATVHGTASRDLN